MDRSDSSDSFDWENWVDNSTKKLEKKEIELTIKNTLQGHSDWVMAVLYYGFPLNKIVSCSYDKTIRIWDSTSYKCIQTIAIHEKKVKQIVKWDDSTFLSCSGDPIVFSVSVSSEEPYHKVEKEFSLSDFPIENIHVLSDEVFCFSNLNDVIFIVSYVDNTLLKKLNFEGIYWNVEPTVSNLHDDCFYFNKRDEKSTIALYDYKQEQIRMNLDEHNNCILGSMLVFSNFENEEILISCGKEYNDETLFVYNTHKKENRLIFQKVVEFNMNSTCWCCVLSRKYKYLTTCDYHGNISFFDMENDFKSVYQRNVHQFRIFDVKLLSNTSKSLRMITCSRDKLIHVVELRNFEINTFEEDQDKLDSQERKEFVFSTHEKIFFEKIPVFCLDIHIMGVKFLCVPRLFCICDF